MRYNYILLYYISHRDLGEIIVSNFCLNHGRKKMFPRNGLLALAEIIRNDSGDDDCIARQTLLLHASKGDLEMLLAANLFIWISKMHVVQEEDNRMKIWNNIGIKLITHKEVSVHFYM